MGRMYSCSFDATAASGDMDIIELTAPATAVVVVHEIHLTQETLEVSEQLPMSILRVPATVTAGTGGITGTARKLGGVLDASASSTLKAFNGTLATTSGTLETLRRSSENFLNGWHWVFTPETRIVVPPSGVIVVRMATAPSVTLTMDAEIIFEEIG
jgi:hypothetical protein